MNKLSYNRTLGWLILAAAIVAAAVWGQVKKPAPLPQVSYGTWVCDEAGLLADATEQMAAQYNKNWDSRYGAIIAVATVESIKGWQAQNFADTLGNKWGLGANDMLLLIYPDGNGVEYWVSQGQTLLYYQMDSQAYALKSAIESAIYSDGADAGTQALFMQADVYYAQVIGSNSAAGYDSADYGSGGWEDRSGGSVMGVLLLIVVILVVWALLDRVRYNRYRRRTVVVGAPRVTYYPIFWGRPSAPRHPYRPAPPLSPRRSGQPPRSGGTVRRSAPPASRPSSRPGSGFGGGGFGGSRSSGGSRGGSFGGGGFGGGKRR